MSVDAAKATPTIFLVLTTGAVNTRTGGGQRTQIFFEAAKKVGPVEVLLLGDQVRETARSFFPGATEVHLLKADTFKVRKLSRIEALKKSIDRFVRTRSEYAPDPQVVAALAPFIARPGPKAFMFRYTIAFSKSGMAADPAQGSVIAVDIDDRDDQKYDTEFRRRFGDALTDRVIAPLVIAPLARHVETLMRRASLLWLAAREDLAAFPQNRTELVPNVPFATGSADLGPASGGRDVLFVGSFQHAPNQNGVRWFLAECWPKIRAANPTATCRIVGLGPWDSLAPDFPGIEGVTFVGPVDDLEAEYARARVTISPIQQGGGSKIKVIESCAYARPIVATSHSLRGFESDLQRAISQADTPETFADALTRYLTDPALADETGTSLRALQRQHFSREGVEAKIAADLHSLLDPLMAKDRAAS